MNSINFIEERKKFGKHILKLRKRIKSLDYPNRSISQQELCDRAESLSKKTLGEIERGQTNATFDSLLSLKKVLGVSFEELVNY